MINIAKVVHQANKAYCEELKDFSQVPWEQADDSIKASVESGVREVLADPGITAEESHSNWMEFKLNAGWTHGPIKSEHLKEHPCLVPFDELPEEQQIKDKLFIAIVNAITLTNVKVPTVGAGTTDESDRIPKGINAGATVTAQTDVEEAKKPTRSEHKKGGARASAAKKGPNL